MIIEIVVIRCSLSHLKYLLAFTFFRNLEDFVTWVDTSAIKKHIMEYNDTVRVFHLTLNITLQIDFNSLLSILFKELVFGF